MRYVMTGFDHCPYMPQIVTSMAFTRTILTVGIENLSALNVFLKELGIE
jgi:hypothetical protein